MDQQEHPCQLATDELTGESGASPIYTDLAIDQTQGLLESVFELIAIESKTFHCPEIESRTELWG